MSKEIYISSTPHETRLAIVEDEALTEIYYERENEYTLAGSIYNGRVTRVLPGMQSSFVDIGLERDAFLYITDFLEEAPDSEEFDTTSHGDRPPRTIEADANGGAPRTGERNERGDRGGRGRRGGRDRQRNGDRMPADRDRSDAPRVAAPVQSDAIPAGPTERAEVGEGAPGADGNRRWRGRRGRRRGRGTPGQPGDATPQNGNAAALDESGFSADESSFDAESYREIDGAADEQSVTPPVMEHRSERGGDRGRRNDGRGGQRFDSRRNEQGREPRAPRGFAPSRDLYGVASDAERSTGPIANAYDDSAASGEPIVLPGESLSKYRKGDESVAAPATSAPAPHTTTVTLAPPANLYTLAEGWDGGATLPGETLSRRRPSEPAGDARRPQRDFEREGRRDNRAGRDSRGGRSEFRNASSGPVQFSGAEESRQREGREEGREPLNIQQLSASQAEENNVPPHTALADLPETALPHEAPVAAAAEPAPVHEVEYEPSEASASYRVDPVAPSEFRQSAPVLEPPVETAEETALHSETEGDTAEAHDITSIAPSGEMHSERVETLAATEHLPAPIETPEAASPIRHEGAIVDTQADQDSAETGGGFDGRQGQVEEETIDDEFEGATLQASSIEEIDDLEEETLEGAADLGTMLREMSIDQITRKSPVEDEDDAEDDLDEDDLDEEDLDHDDADDEEQDGDPAEAEYDPQEQSARAEDGVDGEFFDQESGQHNVGEENGGGAILLRVLLPSRVVRLAAIRIAVAEGVTATAVDAAIAIEVETAAAVLVGNRTVRRHSMQTTNLPAISDLLKPGQEILVQIAKEPIAKKGARITSHIALPGRFLVFMPTVNHTGVSRKIESDGRAPPAERDSAERKG